MGVEDDLNEELLDPANFLRAQGNLMKYKKEYMAKKMHEDNFKKHYTFAPDTKLTKGKVIPKHPQQKPEENNPMRASVGSINLDGIAKKKSPGGFIKPAADEKEKKPRHAELYNLRKR